MIIASVTPCYNTQKYILKALGSILNQQNPPDLVIMVDDGSTDDSVNLVENTFGDRVRIVKKEHSGIAPTLNAGFEEAIELGAEAIAWLSADDEWEPQKLLAQEAVLERNPGSVIFSNWFIINDKGEVVGIQKERSCVGDRQAFLREVKDRCCVNFSTTLIPSDVWKKVGPFRCSPGEDYEWLIRAAPFYPFVLVQEFLTRYRRHAEMTTITHAKVLSDTKIWNSALSDDMVYQAWRKSELIP